MAICLHPSILPDALGYVCMVCGQKWAQLALVDAIASSDSPTLPKPPEAPFHPSYDRPAQNLPDRPLESLDTPIHASYDHVSPTVSHDVYIVPSGRGIKYFRYVCTTGGIITYSEHIPGGNTTNALARRRADIVRRWMAANVPPAEIKHRIEQWKIGKGDRSKSPIHPSYDHHD